MLEKATIARSYAEAAFSFALEEGRLRDWSVMLNLLATVIADKDMQRIISHPKINADQLHQFIVDICGDKLDGNAKNFVKILIAADRIGLAANIVSIFEQKRAAAEGVSEVDVISAYPLDDAQINTISNAISKNIGKKIDINTSIDTNLIGGVVIRAGDSVIDVSLRGRIKTLNNLFAQ